MSNPHPSLVSTEWLAEHLDDPRVVVLDGSKHLPAAGRDEAAEFAAAHIPGARFFDIASLVDETSPVPSAFPRPDQVAQRLADLGVRLGDKIVIYDDSAVKTSARAWFTLTAHGIENVAVLDGGLGKWRAEERPLESGTTSPTPAEPTALQEAGRLRFKADMLANLETKAEQVLDARAADRVYGAGIDPVHGGQNGRIPGSCNLPFGELFNADGTYKSVDELREAFRHAGIDLDAPVTTTCGSGITASVLAFALHLLGKEDWALYDGSWSEWESDPDTPKEQGPQS